MKIAQNNDYMIETYMYSENTQVFIPKIEQVICIKMTPKVEGAAVGLFQTLVLHGCMFCSEKRLNQFCFGHNMD